MVPQAGLDRVCQFCFEKTGGDDSGTSVAFAQDFLDDREIDFLRYLHGYPF
jgi:hypothetical protein